MKSFLKIVILSALYSLSTLAQAADQGECPRRLVLNGNASTVKPLSLTEAINSLQSSGDFIQLEDYVLIRDGMGFNRRIRYLHALKDLEFKRITEDSLRRLDLKQANAPLVFDMAGETFYLVKTDQFRTIQNVPETFIKSIAGLTLPSLPAAPVQVQTQPRLSVVTAIPQQPAKVPRLTQIEWTTKKKSEKYFAPQSSRLSPIRPLLIITWWNRPGWAVVDAEFLREQGPNRVRDLIRTETQVTITESVYGSLSKYLENPLNHTVFPANKFSSQGMSQMNDILINQTVLVAEESKSRHRLLVLPLMVQDSPTKTVQTPKVPQPSPAPSYPIKPMPVPKPLPPQPLVQRVQSPVNRGTKMAPLVPVNEWVSDIYAPDAPAIGRVNYNFVPALDPARFIYDFDEFERQLELNVPIALPSRLRQGLYELPIYWSEHHEIKIARVTFSFTRYQNGDVMLTISDLAFMEDYNEKAFYQRFAEFHHIEDKEFTLSQPLRVGSISSNRLSIHRKIRSKLLLKHDLNLKDQDKLLESLGNINRNSRGYRARVQFEGHAYSIYVDSEENGQIVVKSAFIDQRD